jgi:hypothetical protein
MHIMHHVAVSMHYKEQPIADVDNVHAYCAACDQCTVYHTLEPYVSICQLRLSLTTLLKQTARLERQGGSMVQV